MAHCIALMGWSLPAMESAEKLDIPYVVVSYPDFENYAKEHNIPFVGWEFNEWNETNTSLQLAEKLKPFDVDLAIPLFEETVEWSGALNSIFREDPRLFNRSCLFRNKAMMKRKALLAGLRVGLFDEVYNTNQVHKFMDRLNQANLQIEGEEDAWVHLKPFDAAGTVGHKLLRSRADIDEKISEKDFPCMVESHLPGKEFSCEAFIHDGKIRFMNITEYVKLGYSNYVPCGPELEQKRPKILEVMQRLVDAFGIEYGVIHPEWFLTENDDLSFGEVATRIPGGHIFELISKAYDFDAIQAMILCSDPDTDEATLEEFFPGESDFNQYYGSLMVYPSRGHITRLEVPEELEEDAYFEEHTLLPPAPHKVGDREGYGNHYGTVFLKGEDPERMKSLLSHYQGVDFYV